MEVRIIKPVNAFAIAEKGLEDISVREIKELIDADASVNKTVLSFESTTKNICLLCYKGQSIRRAGILLSTFNFETVEDIEKEFRKLKLDVKNKKCTVECVRSGEHDFKSVDVEQSIGKILMDSGGEVTYKNGEMILYIHIENDYCAIGIDYAGFDLALRDYKVFSHAASLKGTVAYGIMRIAGYDGKQLMVSTFTKGGIIEIEAALFVTGKAVNYYRKDKFAFWKLDKFKDKDATEFFEKYDKESKKKLKLRGISIDLRDITAGKKNAKIAGVDRLITFSRIENDWMDVKFADKEIDILVAQPIGKEFKDLFYQADYVAKKIIVVTTGQRCDDDATKFGFSLVEERVLERGQGKIIIQVFGK